jgi:hypothetical protein
VRPVAASGCAGGAGPGRRARAAVALLFLRTVTVATLYGCPQAYLTIPDPKAQDSDEHCMTTLVLCRPSSSSCIRRHTQRSTDMRMHGAQPPACDGAARPLQCRSRVRGRLGPAWPRRGLGVTRIITVTRRTRPRPAHGPSHESRSGAEQDPRFRRPGGGSLASCRPQYLPASLSPPAGLPAARPRRRPRLPRPGPLGGPSRRNSQRR